MPKGFRPWIAAVAILAIVGVGGAQAASVTLSGGWVASWDSSLDPFLSITQDLSNTGTNNVVIEKRVEFTSAMVNPLGFVDPVAVVFQQTSADAKPLIVIADETVTNSTGAGVNAFRFSVLDGSTGTSADSRFDKTATGIGTSGGFNIAPFTTSTYTQNDQVLTLGGGTIANGATWTPGQGAGNGELVINAIPTASGAFRTFVFKEQPGQGGGVVIPLPAAAWMGLSGLLGLGLVSGAKKIRQLIA